MKEFLSLLGVLILFAGCTHSTIEKGDDETSTVYTHGVSRAPLICPTAEKIPSVRSVTQESCSSSNWQSVPVCERIREYESFLSDIPVPLSVEPVQLWEDQSGCVVVLYYSSDSLEQLENFYRCEMERMGWMLVAAFVSDQSEFIFKKPGDIFCTISCAHKRKGWKKKYSVLRISVQGI